MTRTTELPPADPQLADLDQILFSKGQIAARVTELGEQIAEDYRDKNLVLVGILKGSMMFLSDLSRAIRIPHEYDLVGAHSYKGGTKPTEHVSITKDLDINVEGRDVILIEDIYDTGNTLATIHTMIGLYHPKSLAIASFLYKARPRARPLDIKYVGFEIDEVFVVGYGLDYRERYRNLPCIGVLNSEIYQ